jgi:hypothetical protein
MNHHYHHCFLLLVAAFFCGLLACSGTVIAGQAAAFAMGLASRQAVSSRTTKSTVLFSSSLPPKDDMDDNMDVTDDYLKGWTTRPKKNTPTTNNPGRMMIVNPLQEVSDMFHDWDNVVDDFLYKRMGNGQAFNGQRKYKPSSTKQDVTNLPRSKKSETMERHRRRFMDQEDRLLP